MRPTRKSTLLALLFLMPILLAACTALRQLPEPGAVLPDPASAIVSSMPVDATLPQLAAVDAGALEQIYSEVSPSVVHIQVVQNDNGVPFVHPQGPDMPDLELPDVLPPLRGEGSGFVWDTKGHVVTNNHVVENAERITVIFAEGTQVDATLAGADSDSDLAVLKVDAPAELLQPVQIGESTTIQVGELAIAIGNPFGQEGTMTVGIISALGRLLPIDSGDPFGPRYNIPDVIQTDAAINPGNSGGVLLNSQGEVIGVTSAMISASQTSSGIGFAIPSAIVQQVIPVLIADGHYEHPFLGINGTTLTPDLAEAMGLPADQRGTLVIEVIPDGPAEKAGLQGSDQEVEVDGGPAQVGGDVIVSFGDQTVESMDDLITQLARATRVGQRVKLTVLRQGEEESLQVTLTARPKSESSPLAGTSADVQDRPWLGVLGVPVIPEIAEAMELPDDLSGILILQVEHGSPADDAGLMGSYKPTTIDGNPVLVGGDVIVEIDGNAVAEPQDLLAILESAHPGDALAFNLLRDGKEMQVDVTLAERPG